MQTYLAIGGVLGWISGFVTFIGSYIYCVATYGFLFGLGLGWLPSMILGSLVGVAVAFLWGPALVLVGIGVLMLIR